MEEPGATLSVPLEITEIKQTGGCLLLSCSVSQHFPNVGHSVLIHNFDQLYLIFFSELTLDYLFPLSFLLSNNICEFKGFMSQLFIFFWLKKKCNS